jgi:hypothetical protein
MHWVLLPAEKFSKAIKSQAFISVLGANILGELTEIWSRPADGSVSVETRLTDVRKLYKLKCIEDFLV